MQKKKTNQGRKKVEIKKIEDLYSRQVTFSKRRARLFNRASELSVLTEAKAAVPVDGRVSAFGHPNIETVMDSYLGENSSEVPGQQQPESEPDPAMHEGLKYSQQYSEIFKEFLEAEKNKKAAAAKETKEENNNSFWWEEPIISKELAKKNKKVAVPKEIKEVNNNSFWWEEAIISMEDEKNKKAAAAKETKEENNNSFWWEDGLGLEEFDEYITAMED